MLTTVFLSSCNTATVQSCYRNW